MGKIFYILGKSSTGKDTIYNKILEDKDLGLKKLTMYTTRPIRDGEKQGESYHFVSEEEYVSIKESGKIVEERSYNTMHGIWRYFTVDNEKIDLNSYSYVAVGVLASFVSIKEYYGKDIVIPIYIDLDDGERLKRALKRELRPENRKFTEMCRRFLADTEDFAPDKIESAGIDRFFVNGSLSKCVGEIKEYIKKEK